MATAVFTDKVLQVLKALRKFFKQNENKQKKKNENNKFSFFFWHKIIY